MFFEIFFDFFLKTGSFSKRQGAKNVFSVISAPLRCHIRRATGNIIYQRFSFLQIIFGKILQIFAIFSGFSGEIRGDRGKIAGNGEDKTGGRLALCRVPRGAKRGVRPLRRSGRSYGGQADD